MDEDERARRWADDTDARKQRSKDASAIHMASEHLRVADRMIELASLLTDADAAALHVMARRQAYAAREQLAKISERLKSP